MSGSTANWMSYETASRQAAAGIGELPLIMQMSEDEAWSRLTSPSHFPATCRFLAVLGAWRTLTGEQIEAMSDCSGASNSVSKLVAAAFRVGLLDMGTVNASLKRSDRSNRSALYRPSATRSFERFAEHLTYPEWVSLTGGTGWERGGQYDRHNVLTTELGLRIAEYTDVATVLGEKLSSIDLLAGTGIGYDRIGGDTRSADMTVVRGDGLRIAVEVTASIGANFEKKVEKWASILDERPLDDSGLMVLFVIAPPQDYASTVRKDTYAAISRAIRRRPGTVHESVASRIAVATWDEWFPARHQVNQSFLDLAVNLSDGMQAGEMQWKKTSLLDQVAYPYRPRRKSLTAIMDNRHLLWSAPTWLREPESAPTLLPHMMGEAAKLPLPYKPPARPDRVKGHPPGKGTGAAGDAKVPSRLLPYQ